MKKLHLFAMVSLAAAAVVPPSAVLADAISPGIRDTGKVYSTETPNSSFFGTGTGARAAEASQLRFEAERAMQDGRFEESIVKLKKATQFDPADPQTHLLLARALTKRFYTKKGPVDEKLLAECLSEWNMLWHHDSDQWDQLEAKGEARKMMRIAKALAKQHKQEQLANETAKDALAESRKEAAGKVASKISAQGNQTQKRSRDDDSEQPAEKLTAAQRAARTNEQLDSALNGPEPAAKSDDKVSKQETSKQETSKQASSKQPNSKQETASSGAAEGTQIAHKKKHFLLF